MQTRGPQDEVNTGLRLTHRAWSRCTRSRRGARREAQARIRISRSPCATSRTGAQGSAAGDRQRARRDCGADRRRGPQSRVAGRRDRSLAQLLGTLETDSPSSWPPSPRSQRSSLISTGSIGNWQFNRKGRKLLSPRRRPGNCARVPSERPPRWYTITPELQQLIGALKRTAEAVVEPGTHRHRLVAARRERQEEYKDSQQGGAATSRGPRERLASALC